MYVYIYIIHMIYLMYMTYIYIYIYMKCMYIYIHIIYIYIYIYLYIYNMMKRRVPPLVANPRVFLPPRHFYCFELQMWQVQIVDLAGSERLKPYEDGSQQDKARDGDGELVKQGIFLLDL